MSAICHINYVGQKNQTTASPLFNGANGTLGLGMGEVIHCCEIVPSRTTYDLLPISVIPSTMVSVRAEAVAATSDRLSYKFKSDEDQTDSENEDSELSDDSMMTMRRTANHEQKRISPRAKSTRHQMMSLRARRPTMFGYRFIRNQCWHVLPIPIRFG
jgi:hypothetical protein